MKRTIKGTVIITDPCYIKEGHSIMQRNTIYGDWSCMVYNGKMEENKKSEEWDKYYFDFFKRYNFDGLTEEDKENLAKEFEEHKKEWLANNTMGEFCADSGNVGVFLADLLTERDLEWCKNHPWCATIINDFDGDIDFVVDNDNNLHVVGTGNINFFSTQSGL